MSEEAEILSNSGCSQRHEFGVGPSYLRSESQSSEGDHRVRRETTDFGERPQSDRSCPQGSQSQKKDQEFNIIIVNICNKLNI